jgi:hypothetical protein
LGGPFKSEKDFFNFIQGYAVNYRAIEESKVPLLFDVEFNFRITSTGLSSNVKREITAITYDYVNLVGRYAELMDRQDAEAAGAGDTDQSQVTAAKIQASKGRPSVVYWEEN